MKQCRDVTCALHRAAHTEVHQLDSRDLYTVTETRLEVVAVRVGVPGLDDQLVLELSVVGECVSRQELRLREWVHILGLHDHMNNPC